MKYNSRLGKFYSYFRKQLPPNYQARLTKLVFLFSGKPFVKKDELSFEKKFPNNERGGLILSADFEMAWAFRYTKEVSEPVHFALEKAKQERQNFNLLLPLFEKYDVPVTWATVGHLFLSECNKETHSWMRRIPYFENKFWEFRKGDWFDDDPNSNFNESPEWYAPDLIQMIKKSGVKHEIATHTFSHIDFSEKNCPPEVADDEIKACIEHMSESGFPNPKSICFPSGSYGNVAILKKYGIQIYRRKIKEFQLAYPNYDEVGLLVTLSSDAFDRSLSSWSAKDYQYKYKKALNKAIKTGTVAHFMFHPSMDPWMITEVMDPVLKYAVQKRNEGKLWIGTMGEIADFINRSNNKDHKNINS